MGLKLCCVASGSKGNCCYVSDGETDILIDLGISAGRAEAFLRAIGVDPDGVHIFVTHSHSDHINGIKNYRKKHPRAEVLCPADSARAVTEYTGVVPTVAGGETAVGRLTVRAVPVSHDVPCCGYVISDGVRSVAVATDLGEVSDGLIDAVGGCGLVVLEANHDSEKLKHNPHYSPVLKARIASAHGHLSNSACAHACARLAARGVRSFILAHLSEENNAACLAVAAVMEELGKRGITDARVVAAAQDAPTGLFEVC